MKKVTVRILVVVLIISSLFVIATGCKKKTSSYQQWKEVLEEYDEWVDEYIAFMKKYKANPSDYSMISDYTKLLSQYSQWATKLSAISKDNTLSVQEQEIILAEYNRITQKLTKAGL